jgi:hypothetical protein
MARVVATESLTGVLVRFRTSVELIDDVDLDAVAARYAGGEHDDVQTLVALAREARMIEKALTPSSPAAENWRYQIPKEAL